MKTVIESYKTQIRRKKEGDVMGLIRNLFPDLQVETFMSKRKKK